MIQVHYIYCALYFYDYYISSTLDQQALGPGSWGPPDLGNITRALRLSVYPTGPPTEAVTPLRPDFPFNPTPP